MRRHFLASLLGLINPKWRQQQVLYQRHFGLHRLVLELLVLLVLPVRLFGRLVRRNVLFILLLVFPADMLMVFDCDHLPECLIVFLGFLQLPVVCNMDSLVLGSLQRVHWSLKNIVES
jgi:hypothetical protein